MSQLMVQVVILIIFILAWAGIIIAGVLFYRWLKRKGVL